MSAMKWMRCWWCVILLVGGVVAATVVKCGGASVEEQAVSVETAEQHVPGDDDSFSPLSGEENGSYQGSGVEAYLKTFLKGGPLVEKEPLCIVICFRADPVCGSDGVTYWCGVAEAKCAEVEIAHEGYCDIGNGGVGANLGLQHALQSLQLVHMLWLVLAGFLIIIGLP